MTFHVGQKVVCVNSLPCPYWGALPLKDAAIYTVASTGIDNYGNQSVELIEVSSPHPTNQYRAIRFRPAVERKTDISIFQKMLTDNRVDA